MTDLLSNIVFSGFLIIVAGITASLQPDGGIMGFFYVISNIIAIPKLGAGTTLSIVVCSQVIMACIIDHCGVFDSSPQRNYSLGRILGSIGLVFFVFIIARY
ncbi:hypothetical protein BC941DRAFT_452181 [Chlamydoabsidia padenii]|nr:hypothetical protein BC941DRAFT_452181 [Chlamydoabsidia padenii]